MIKNADSETMADLRPILPASIPVRAVNITPPIPVAVVIIAVAVAFLFPESCIRVVRTLGYIAPQANPRGMHSAITTFPFDIIDKYYQKQVNP